MTRVRAVSRPARRTARSAACTSPARDGERRGSPSPGNWSRSMRRNLIWAVVLVLASFGLAQAQETTSGSLTGQVVDAQGAPVPGATVTVASPQGDKSFTTDSNGRFFA